MAQKNSFTCKDCNNSYYVCNGGAARCSISTYFCKKCRVVEMQFKEYQFREPKKKTTTSGIANFLLHESKETDDQLLKYKLYTTAKNEDKRDFSELQFYMDDYEKNKNIIKNCDVEIYLKKIINNGYSNLVDEIYLKKIINNIDRYSVDEIDLKKIINYLSKKYDDKIYSKKSKDNICKNCDDEVLVPVTDTVCPYCKSTNVSKNGLGTILD